MYAPVINVTYTKIFLYCVWYVNNVYISNGNKSESRYKLGRLIESVNNEMLWYVKFCLGQYSFNRCSRSGNRSNIYIYIYIYIYKY